jgi:hypothetical protein
VKATWLTAVCAFVLAAYGEAMPRFF